jgi:hypothetical protein
MPDHFLRYRLYGIDLVVTRALVYAPLTAMLVLFYLGGVVSLQYAFRALTGQESQVAIAALFNPLRSRVQAFVDRRFYRSKYDARKTLEALNDDLAGVVAETMQPAHVGLWLRSETGTRGEQAE